MRMQTLRMIMLIMFGYVRVAVGDDAEERLRKEEAFYRQLHQGYIKHFEALGAPEGTVGIAVRDPAEVARAADGVRRHRPHRGARARARGRRVARQVAEAAAR